MTRFVFSHNAVWAHSSLSLLLMSTRIFLLLLQRRCFVDRKHPRYHLCFLCPMLSCWLSEQAHLWGYVYFVITRLKILRAVLLTNTNSQHFLPPFIQTSAQKVTFVSLVTWLFLVYLFVVRKSNFYNFNCNTVLKIRNSRSFFYSRRVSNSLLSVNITDNTWRINQFEKGTWKRRKFVFQIEHLIQLK